jgi:alkylated DNA repair dioxygenase AlkB
MPAPTTRPSKPNPNAYISLMARTSPKPVLAADLFWLAETVSSFRYREGSVTREEEQTLIDAFAALRFKPSEFQSHLGNRRVVSFGHRYSYDDRKVRASEPLPTWLKSLAPHVAAFADIPVDGLAQAMVTEYPPGAGIGWHRDRPVYEDVIGISLAAPCILRLRQEAESGWKRGQVHPEPRSTYPLRRPVRHAWEHSIRPMDKTRHSITFRTSRDQTEHVKSAVGD